VNNQAPESVSGPSATPPTRRGFFGWVSRKPKLAFFGALAAALIVGAGIGAAGSGQQEELDKRADQIADLRSQLRDEQARRQGVE
jgi:Tfp pilus assembly protein PilO